MPLQLFQWVVDVTAPNLTLLSGPAAVSAAPSGSASFLFMASEQGASLQYSYGPMNGSNVTYGPWVTAPSFAVTLTGLNTTVPYSLRVRCDLVSLVPHRFVLVTR